MRTLCLRVFLFVMAGMTVHAQAQVRTSPAGSYIQSDGSLAEGIYDPLIKTVLFHQAGQELSYPIYRAGETLPLELQFDLLSAQKRNFWVTVIHCDATWKPSRLSFTEYLGGFESCPVRDYSFSFNTRTPYVHYRFTLPNEEMTLKISGNYLLVVYSDTKDHPVLTRRFTVVEKLIDIQAEAVMPSIPSVQQTAQQLNVVVRHPALPLSNPQQEIILCILKNNRWEGAYIQKQPAFVRTNELDYRSAGGILFPGGNEFRHFTTRNLISPLGIQSLNTNGATPQFYLLSDAPRRGHTYSFSEDLNGAFVVRADNRREPEKEAAYVQVRFSVVPSEEMKQSPLYVVGAFNDFQISENNRLVFDSENNEYSTSALLKQGFYDYQYETGTDQGAFEGNYFETGNEYIIYVYYRPASARFDRLIGCRQISSTRQGARYNQSGTLLKELLQQ